MKTSSRHLENVFRLQETSSRCLQDVLIKTNIFALIIHLQKTSSRRLGQEQYICFGHTFSRRFQDVLKIPCQDAFKRFSKLLQDVLEKRLQDIFKTSCQDVMFSKCLKDLMQKRPQDIFKTSCKDVFKTFSRRIININCSY